MTSKHETGECLTCSGGGDRSSEATPRRDAYGLDSACTCGHRAVDHVDGTKHCIAGGTDFCNCVSFQLERDCHASVSSTGIDASGPALGSNTIGAGGRPVASNEARVDVDDARHAVGPAVVDVPESVAGLSAQRSAEASTCPVCESGLLTREQTQTEVELMKPTSHEEAIEMLRQWTESLGCAAPEAFERQLMNHAMTLVHALNGARVKAYLAGIASEQRKVRERATPDASCWDGTDADEPADRGFVCSHEAEIESLQCVYCGNTYGHGHTPRCSVTKFGIHEQWWTAPDAKEGT